MSENQGTQMPEDASPQFDEAQLQYGLDQLHGEQNLPAGIAAGLIGALVGAGIWAAITVITSFQIGWMAVGVGFLVGIVVRTFGKGMDRVFGIVGAVLALLGCGLGNLLTVCGIIAAEYDMGFFEVLSRLSPGLVKELMIATFSPIDVVFYGIAVYEGYKLSFRRLTQQDIETSINGQRAAG